MSWEGSVRAELEQVEERIRLGVESEEPLLTEICMHVIGAGGKRTRPGVMLLSYKAAGGADAGSITNVAATFEMIHSATLIHDDINDDGEIRRGRQAAYKKYGVQKALIAGDFLFVRSFGMGGPWDRRVVEIISDAATAIAESEFLQGAHEFDLDISEKDYLKIIEGKTAKIIEAAALVGSHMADGAPETVRRLGRYGLALGMAFQIVDDVLDVIGDEKVLGKPKGVDMVDGRPTLPLMFALKDAKVSERLGKLFLKQQKSKTDVQAAIDLIKRTDAVEASLARAREFKDSAVSALEHLAPSVYKDGLLDLAEAVVSRRN